MSFSYNTISNTSLRLGQHAIVIGGSIGGLLASRVLANYFEKVTVLDRDSFPDEPVSRKNTPQGRHIHVLLKRGESIIAQLFPQIFAELIKEGAECIDNGRDMRWFHFGGWKTRFLSDISIYCQSRALLEWKIRQVIQSQANIELLQETKVTQFLTTSDKSAITGVKMLRHNQEEEQLLAELVIDASGRGSKTPQWLEALGYPKPTESTVQVDVGYASRIYRRPQKAQFDWKALFIYTTPPAKRVGVISPIEKDCWIVTLAGWLRDYPPDDEEGFLKFAQSLDQPDLYQIIKEAEPVSPIAIHKLPSSLRRHYEYQSKPLEGLLILGDALCSFNPVYGQGMTMSALSALTLDICLQQHAKRQVNGQMTHLSRCFHKRIAKIIDVPWLLTTSEDFRYPETQGRKPFWMRFLNGYMARIHRLVHHDALVLLRFLQVLHLMKHPITLFSPTIVFRVMRGSRR